MSVHYASAAMVAAALKGGKSSSSSNGRKAGAGESSGSGCSSGSGGSGDSTGTCGSGGGSGNGGSGGGPNHKALAHLLHFSLCQLRAQVRRRRKQKRGTASVNTPYPRLNLLADPGATAAGFYFNSLISLCLFFSLQYILCVLPIPVNNESVSAIMISNTRMQWCSWCFSTHHWPPECPPFLSCCVRHCRHFQAHRLLGLGKEFDVELARVSDEQMMSRKQKRRRGGESADEKRRREGEEAGKKGNEEEAGEEEDGKNGEDHEEDNDADKEKNGQEEEEEEENAEVASACEGGNDVLCCAPLMEKFFAGPALGDKWVPWSTVRRMFMMDDDDDGGGVCRLPYHVF